MSFAKTSESIVTSSTRMGDTAHSGSSTQGRVRQTTFVNAAKGNKNPGLAPGSCFPRDSSRVTAADRVFFDKDTGFMDWFRDGKRDKKFSGKFGQPTFGEGDDTLEPIAHIDDLITGRVQTTLTVRAVRARNGKVWILVGGKIGPLPAMEAALAGDKSTAKELSFVATQPDWGYVIYGLKMFAERCKDEELAKKAQIVMDQKLKAVPPPTEDRQLQPGQFTFINYRLLIAEKSTPQRKIVRRTQTKAKKVSVPVPVPAPTTGFAALAVDDDDDDDVDDSNVAGPAETDMSPSIESTSSNTASSVSDGEFVGTNVFTGIITGLDLPGMEKIHGSTRFTKEYNLLHKAKVTEGTDPMTAHHEVRAEMVSSGKYSISTRFSYDGKKGGALPSTKYVRHFRTRAGVVVVPKSTSSEVIQAVVQQHLERARTPNKYWTKDTFYSDEEYAILKDRDLEYVQLEDGTWTFQPTEEVNSDTEDEAVDITSPDSFPALA